MQALSHRPSRTLKPVPYAMLCTSLALTLAHWGPTLGERAASPLARACLLPIVGAACGQPAADAPTLPTPNHET